MLFGVETRREVRGRGRTRIGFAKEQCFQFGVEEPWRDVSSSKKAVFFTGFRQTCLIRIMQALKGKSFCES